MNNSNINIAILGAGVIGLNTALEIQKQFPSSNVTLVAEQLSPRTTSDVAAGIFRPSPSFAGPTETITKAWVKDSYEFYDDLRLTSDAPIAGITQVSGYIFSSTNPQLVRNHLLEPVVPIYRSASEEELKLCPGYWKYGSFYTTLLTECKEFLPWALEKFKLNGGNIMLSTISSFDDVPKYCNIVFNCLGLGAKFLLNDNKLVPMRGQLVKVHAPWVKTFFYADYDTYIVPGMKSVTLGGCRQYESFDCTINQHDKASILERCYNLVPSLRKATVVGDYVGLRPHRSEVRVEAERINTKRGPLMVVHNYGHGGYGVTTAPGTAKYAVKLASDAHKSKSKL